MTKENSTLESFTLLRNRSGSSRCYSSSIKLSLYRKKREILYAISLSVIGKARDALLLPGQFTISFGSPQIDHPLLSKKKQEKEHVFKFIFAPWMDKSVTSIILSTHSAFVVVRGQILHDTWCGGPLLVMGGLYKTLIVRRLQL